MSEKTYTWDRISHAVRVWEHRLRDAPGLSPMSSDGLDLLRGELEAKPHWLVAAGIRASDPLFQRVDVYWTPCDLPVLSLTAPGNASDALTECRAKILQQQLQEWFPLGPVGSPRE